MDYILYLRSHTHKELLIAPVSRMYRLKIIDDFSSAHQLRGYAGKCEELHGHNWKVEVVVRGQQLNSIGLLIDFKDLKTIVKETTGKLDHIFLNDLEAFQDSNPSSELIAKYIFDSIRSKLPGHVEPQSVTVWESDTACAVYTADD